MNDIDYEPELTKGICTECGEECYVRKIESSFSYSGTHCTGGRSGIHYPRDHGQPESVCCGADIDKIKSMFSGKE